MVQPQAHSLIEKLYRGNNYTKYGATEHLGGEVTANSTSGIKGKNVKNRKGSEFRRRDNTCN